METSDLTWVPQQLVLGFELVSHQNAHITWSCKAPHLVRVGMPQWAQARGKWECHRNLTHCLHANQCWVGSNQWALMGVVGLKLADLMDTSGWNGVPTWMNIPFMGISLIRGYFYGLLRLFRFILTQTIRATVYLFTVDVYTPGLRFTLVDSIEDTLVDLICC